MQVVRGNALVPLSADEFADIRRQYSRVVVDVGTGDGRAVRRLAQRHPDWLVIGLDPAWQRMTDEAKRSSRKPARGGLGNTLYVRGVAEEPPAALVGVADEVTVALPWGRLLNGVVRGDHDVCHGLRQLVPAGASLTITIGTDIWRDPVPVEIRHLPELTDEHITTTMRPRFLDVGWRIDGWQFVSVAELGGQPSSWGRRLAGGGHAASRFCRIDAIAV